MNVRILLLAILLLTAAVSASASSDFPLRDKYPQVKPISIEALHDQYDDFIIVDVRSKMEFDVIHIASARHVQVTKSDFLEKLDKIRERNNSTPIAFYCNGHTCAKSYKAAAKAIAAGFDYIYCFDAGIFEWVDTYPERGSLLGQTPADKSKLISKADLKVKMIPFDQFRAKGAEADTLVIDTRDPFQRARAADLPQNKIVDIKGIRNIPMDRMLALLQDRKLNDKHLLIFDAVGKQVRWLQYHLEENGYTRYNFLEKGALGAAEAGGVK